MEETFQISPQGVCSRQMEVVLDGDKVVSLKVVGGCPGNLGGIAALIKGMDVHEVIERLEGIPCRGSRGGSSCPNELAKGLKGILENRK